MNTQTIKDICKGELTEEKIELLTAELQSYRQGEEEALMEFIFEVIGELLQKKEVKKVIKLKKVIKKVLSSNSKNGFPDSAVSNPEAPKKQPIQMSFESIAAGNDEKKTGTEIRTKKTTIQPDTFISTSLVANFDEFANYMSGHAVQLTKTKEYISRKHLPTINELMTEKSIDWTPNTEQEYYPFIHFIYHLALSGRLLEKVSVKSGQLQLIETDRMKIYRKLTDVEKYFFLLETFWVDVNWAKLQDKHHNSIAIQLVEIFSVLSGEEPEQSWNTRDPLTRVGQILKGNTYDWNYFLLYFEWLGLWVCEEDLERKAQRGSKNVYYARKITISPFGAKIIPILLFSRNAQAWNIAFRREAGEFNAIPGSVLEDLFTGELSDDALDRLQVNTKKDQSAQLFFQPFVDLFSKDELQRTLPRNRKKFMDGSYTFKVSLSKGTWRKVTLSAKHTMEDLHQIIIKAFQFDDDHLYSFFMDGRKWSHDCIASPMDDSGHADASKVQIGAQGLFPKQNFLYVFDYGDEWTFVVEIDQINENILELVNPYVKAEKGKAPQQYADFY
ncbi:plasmid pRiA4b ORF-3 family protein [Sporosarcina limicola]|uniref:Shikimate kinase n=1 Tax=Sporosarcina limicola TaxID=34101 RepID=A0A927MMM8_9BACL|nr:plasmid pRiA4b ORF-3 family protein [Sporosarcina limicola]MBE1556791.1 shikimate kinase [Sporosarcina limicola]